MIPQAGTHDPFLAAGAHDPKKCSQSLPFITLYSSVGTQTMDIQTQTSPGFDRTVLKRKCALEADQR